MNLLIRKAASVLFLTSALAGAAACQSIAAQELGAPAIEAGAGQNVGERYLHAPELGPIIMQYITDKGFMDPAFPPTVAAPSPYLTDFYGIQAIKDVPTETIIADMTARGAVLEARNEHSLTFVFADGYTGTFYPLSTLAVAGQKVPISHVDISGTGWREEQGNLRKFRQMIEDAGLAKSYFIANPAYTLEQEVAKQMASGSAARVTVDQDLTPFAAASNAILFLPEGVHGKPDDANKLIDIMTSHKINWIGMEMLGPQQQPLLDAFVDAKEGSPEYQKARDGLLAYFTDNWNGRAGPKVAPEQLYYFKLVEAARERGVRVIGIEQTTLPFLLFRYGESVFGGAVRSLEWQRNLPEKGRGIVFGGSGHYSLSEPINVQDFVAAATPSRPLFSLMPLPKKPN